MVWRSLVCYLSIFVISNHPLAASVPSPQTDLHPFVTAELFDQTEPSETMPEDSVGGVTASTLELIREQAEAITVKVFAGDSQGSGTIIQHYGTTYRVITNEHVLKSSTKIRVKTEDGRVYEAFRNWTIKFNGNDLAVLEFRSSVPYTVARIGSSVNLQPGETMFAGGYPYTDDLFDRQQLAFTEGQVAFLSDKAFVGGYQLGYSNNIRKGMSGGPVLNKQGELVAINGMHAQPLWGNPYIFQDGSQPPSSLRKVLARSSWGIPIEAVLKFSTIAG
jgi:S1-C subfamily serine protease